jgi:dTDP-4-amino-4,6-dideoxygalactose transaminase
MTSRPVHVTQPSLAPLPEFVQYLQQIWDSGVMTHNGPLMQRLERELAAYLRVPDVVAVANGTCALQLAIRALDLGGEIITSPFTFVATGSIITWERCRPVFVDIDPATWNIDPKKIEAAITPRTSAIMPVHVFGVPCDIAAVQAIAARRGLRVIYDAAHAMAVDVGGRSALDYGDVSAVSFHATKLLNTGEGGACLSRDPDLMARLRRMRFFGFDEAKEIADLGMNAKMTEVAAALGLANLQHLEPVKRNRRRKYERYRGQLEDLPFLQFQRYHPEETNYSYMPVLFDTEDRMQAALSVLARAGVHPRRYFHPSLNTVPVFQPQPRLPVAESVSSRIACLPLYDTLPDDDIDRIAGMLRAL